MTTICSDEVGSFQLYLSSGCENSRDEALGYVIDILEPHGTDWKDNLGKAKGLAQYAEDEGLHVRLAHWKGELLDG